MDFLSFINTNGMNDNTSRLNEVYDYLLFKHIINSHNDLAIALKTSRPAVTAMLNGRQKVSVETLRKIYEAYPGVFDLNYLLTGEGSLMVAHGGDTTPQSGEKDHVTVEDYNDAIWAKDKTIESLKETIAALEAEIERLKESNNVEIEYLKRKIQIMEMDADAVRIQHRMDLEKANIMSIPK